MKTCIKRHNLNILQVGKCIFCDLSCLGKWNKKKKVTEIPQNKKEVKILLGDSVE